MMTVPMDRSCAPSSRELAQRLLKKNIELENGLRRAAQTKVPSDPNAWLQMRENYETIILEDHDFSEKHDIEYVLWQLHYRRIEEFRQHINATASAGSNASSGGKVFVRPDKVKKIRSVFKSFLMEATGFYHDLILKIRTKYGLPLSYFNEGTQNEIVLTKDEKKSADMKKGLMSCHRCLIYLGDLARYKGLYGEGDSVSRDYAAASSYYIQAASLCPSSGNPYHQLAILASYSGDELLAVYRYFRSLAVEIPFSTARDNLIIAFEKNRQSYSQLPSNIKTTSGRRLPTHSTGRGKGRGDAKLLAKDSKVEITHSKEQELTMSEVFKAFSIGFVRLHGILFTRTSLETFGEVFCSVINNLNVLLSSGPEEVFHFGLDAAENASVILRLIAILIFTVHYVKKEPENQSYAEILQRMALLQNAFTASFEFAGCILKRCIELRDAASSYLLPSIMVFIEWLACHPDVAAGFDVEEKQADARSFFWNQCIPFMNKIILTGLASVDGNEDETCFSNMSRYDEGETGNRLALWEDFELRGFLPLMPAQTILDFSRKHAYRNDRGKDKISRAQRLMAAGRALANIVSVDQQRIYIDPRLKKFVLGTEPPVLEDHIDFAFSSALDSAVVTEGCQFENVADLGAALSTPGLGVTQTTAQLYVGEEEEEIVFKPMVFEKYPDVTASMLTAFDLVNPVQVSSAGNWTTHGQHLSAPFDDVQISAVSNVTPKLRPSATTVSQLPLEHLSAPFDGVRMSAVSNVAPKLHPSATTVSQLPLQHLSAPFEGVQMSAVSNVTPKLHPSTATVSHLPLQHLSAPFDGVQMSAASNVTPKLYPSTTIISQLPLQHLSAPFDGVQMAAVSNVTPGLHSSTTTVSQLPLQYMNSDTSRWFMKQQSFLSDGLRNMNITENGSLNKHMMQPSSFSPVVPSPVSLNANSTPSSQIKASEVVFPSTLDTPVPAEAASDVMAFKLSAALPSLRNNPVSRPVRHSGPPPGFTRVTSKQQDEAIPNYFAKEQLPEIDDYSWLDGYHSSSIKGMGMEKAFDQIMLGHPYVNTSSTTAFTNISSFPFPGKQVSSEQNQMIDGQKWHDFQLFEQLNAHPRQKLQQSSPQHALLPEKH